MEIVNLVHMILYSTKQKNGFLTKFWNMLILNVCHDMVKEVFLNIFYLLTETIRRVPSVNFATSFW